MVLLKFSSTYTQINRENKRLLTFQKKNLTTKFEKQILIFDKAKGVILRIHSNLSKSINFCLCILKHIDCYLKIVKKEKKYELLN